MHIPFVDLKAQYRSIKPEIDAAIGAVIGETAFVGGKYVKEFEEAFAAYLGVSHCIGCANGTDALELIMRGLGIGAGDEVIVPANSFVATSEAVTSTGARVVFVDNHPELFTIDVDKLDRAITKKTKAAIAVHLYGLPAEMDRITAIAARHGIHVIEDAAQGHGAKHRGKNIATFGVAAGFSFYPGKNLGAYGDGGCVATSDPDLATRVRMIANHGRIGKYDHEMEGRNSRLDGIQAAILKTKLTHLEEWTEARRKNAGLYKKHLGGSGIQLPTEPGHSRHVYHLYVVQVENRAPLQTKLKEAGIESGVHYPIALPLLQAYKYLGHTPKDFPVASSQMSMLLSLPMFPELSEEQIIMVSEVVRSNI